MEVECLRERVLDYTYTADQGSGAAAVEEANVILLDANNGVASMAETDSSGEAGLLFNVYTVDKNGQDDMDLNDTLSLPWLKSLPVLL